MRRLTSKKVAEKRLAITVFSFPPDKGNVGTAAYLNVFGSIFRVLQDLQREGYNVGEIPADEKALMEKVGLSCKHTYCPTPQSRSQGGHPSTSQACFPGHGVVRACVVLTMYNCRACQMGGILVTGLSGHLYEVVLLANHHA